jgi:hypothetical protein
LVVFARISQSVFLESSQDRQDLASRETTWNLENTKKRRLLPAAARSRRRDDAVSCRRSSRVF